MSSAAAVFNLAQQPVDSLVALIRRGLPATAFKTVALALNLSTETLARKLGVAPRTLARKQKSKTALSAEETEKLLRVVRVRHLAQELFTGDAAISAWLSTPAPALGGKAPIDLLDTDVGTREVEGLILGLAHGQFQ